MILFHILPRRTRFSASASVITKDFPLHFSQLFPFCLNCFLYNEWLQSCPPFTVIRYSQDVWGVPFFFSHQTNIFLQIFKAKTQIKNKKKISLTENYLKFWGIPLNIISIWTNISHKKSMCTSSP